MNTHVLQTRTRKGSTIELGHVNSLEKAARLARSIECGLGEPFHVTLVELDVVTVRSVSYSEERRRRA